jgi:hypothetical protein
MIFAGSPLVLDEVAEPPREAERSEATALGRERRESERAIAYWERKATQLGTAPTIGALDLGAIETMDWGHRFVIAVDPVVADSSLLLYGVTFARLAGLPVKSAPHVPLALQLPRRLTNVLMHGCDRARSRKAPVRLEGEIDLLDGRKEQYRAAFIPVGLSPQSSRHFTFGAYNSRVTATS